MTSRRRGQHLPVALVAAAAVVVLLVASRPRVAVEGAQVSGAATPVATALALVALAGAGALVFFGPLARRVVSALLVAVGAAIIASMWGLLGSQPAAWFAYGPAGTGSRVEVGISVTAWAGVGAGVVMCFASAWLVARPTLRPAGRGAGADAVAGDHEDRPTRPASAWDALDRGEDPTE